MIQQIHNLLGLMARARTIDVGMGKIEDGIRKKKYVAIILAEDAEEKTRHRVLTKATNKKIPVIEYGTKETLAQAIGKELTVAIGIKEMGFYQSLVKILDNKK